MKIARMCLMVGMAISVIYIGAQTTSQQIAHPINGQESKSFHWSNGKRGTVSLSFDDARVSQIDTGLALLRKEDVRVTFLVTSSSLDARLEGWKQAVADGHEIGNHSLTHPCTGNYSIFFE